MLANRFVKMGEEINNLLKDEFEASVKKCNELHSGNTDAEVMFDEWWRDQAGTIQRKIKNTLKPIRIDTVVQGVIIRALKNDSHLYWRASSQEENKKPKADRVGSTKTEKEKPDLKRTLSLDGQDSFTVKKKHIELKDQYKKSKTFIEDTDLQCLQIISNHIIQKTKVHYDASTPVKGKEFSSKDAERLFDEVLRQVEDIEEERFEVTKKYKRDLILFIEARAVEGFKVKHDVYIRENSRQALLEKKKKLCRNIFMAKVGRGELAVDFSQSVLKDLIWENIFRKLNHTELLTDLRKHCGDIFKTAKHLQAHTLIDLLQRDNFYSFAEYITNYESFMKEELHKRSVEYFKKGDRPKQIMKGHVDHIIHVILEALNKIVKNLSKEIHFFQTFFTNIQGLIIPHRYFILKVLPAPVPYRERFRTFVEKELVDSVKFKLYKTIDSSDEGNTLSNINLAPFLFNEIVSCREKCPFCGAPCDAHSGSSTSGKHSATFHRPSGLKGYKSKVFIRNTRLFTDSCNSLIMSKETFMHSTTRKLKKFSKYQKYYPKWTIMAENDPDLEKYWKYVFARYNNRFASYYGAKPGKVPEEWEQFGKEEIIEEVKKNYGVKVDVDPTKYKSTDTQSCIAELSHSLQNFL